MNEYEEPQDVLEDAPPEQQDIVETPEHEEQAGPDQNDDAPEETPSVEALASEMGWSPKDNWRGEPDAWKPADQYLKHTVDVNRKLKKSLHNVEERLDTMARTSAAITEKAVAEARADAQKRFNEAVELGDAEAAAKASQEFYTATPPPPPSSPERDQFIERNPWFNQDQDATNYAIAKADEYANLGISQARQLQMVERDVKAIFPDLYPEKPAPAKQPPAVLKPGARAATKKAGKGFSDLPPQAQQAAKQFAASGKCSVEQYADIYFKEQG